MDDLISRQATYLALVEKGQASKRYKLGETWELNAEEIREVLDALPPAEPKKGKWIDKGVYTYVDDHRHLYKCDQCGNGWLDTPDFCPNCGADMRGEQDERLNQQTGGD